jgi:hypothetical protein
MGLMRFRKTIALDFDGVIHQHVSPWTVAHEIHDLPVPGAFAFIKEALDEFDVTIFSARANDSRGARAILDWLVKYWGEADTTLLGRLVITARKPHAFIYIDDRGWRFEGTFPTMAELRTFDSWTKKLRKEEEGAD